jgi:hypothetical protein
MKINNTPWIHVTFAFIENPGANYLGKKWFAFSKMDIGAAEMLGKLKNV